MSLENRRLPPLTALRVFASAGKHENFTAAASELCLTTGAVSRQIKQLEEHVGVSLFTRVNHDVCLTEQGRIFHAEVCSFLNRLEAGTNRLIGSAQSRPLHILSPMTLALRWLAPRLPSFHRRYPHQQIRLTTTLSPMQDVATAGSEVDIAFLLGRSPLPGWSCDPVIEGRLLLVCSPQLIAPRRRLDSLAELAGFTLLKSTLQQMARPNAWDSLIAGSGLDQSALPTVEFPSSGLAVQAAIEGRGIAAGEYEFIQADLEAGRLIAPFGHSAATGHFYYMVVCAPQAGWDERIQRFRSWLLEECRMTGEAVKSARSKR